MGLLAWLEGIWRRAAQPPLPAAPELLPEQRAVVEQLPFFATLQPSERDPLCAKTSRLVAAKSWEGCGGLELTDVMRVTIAAQAALLVLHHDVDDYPGLQSILVYPGAFRNPLLQTDASGVVGAGAANLGEAWQRGPVVLSWDAARAGVENDHDGRNLVFHEFAHKLDMLDGYANGCPPLADRSAHRAWRGVMSREFEALRSADAHRRATVLDKYGATNPAEFFAVVTECFFERGRELRRLHPAMYTLLVDYFGQDPAERSAG